MGGKSKSRAAIDRKSLLALMQAHTAELLAILRGLLADQLFHPGQVQRGTEHGAFGQIDFPIADAGRQADVQSALDKPSEFRMPNVEPIAAGKNDAERGERATSKQFLDSVDHTSIVSSLGTHHNDATPALPVATRDVQAKPAKAVCRCGLRATRETELAETFPAHVVCAWIGNSESVARKHYLQVTDEHFAAAAKPLPEAVQKAAQNPAQSAHATARNDQQAESAAQEKTPVLQGFAAKTREISRYPHGGQNRPPETSGNRRFQGKAVQNPVQLTAIWHLSSVHGPSCPLRSERAFWR